MKSIVPTLLLMAICLFISCAEDNAVQPEVIDKEAPQITDLKWIDYSFIENDIGGSIVDNENYTISIESGFQTHHRVKDASIIESGVMYFTVNNDETIRQFYDAFSTDDFNEGRTAFLEKRKPKF